MEKMLLEKKIIENMKKLQCEAERALQQELKKENKKEDDVEEDGGGDDGEEEEESCESEETSTSSSGSEDCHYHEHFHSGSINIISKKSDEENYLDFTKISSQKTLNNFKTLFLGIEEIHFKNEFIRFFFKNKKMYHLAILKFAEQYANEFEMFYANGDEIDEDDLKNITLCSKE